MTFGLHVISALTFGARATIVVDPVSARTRALVWASVVVPALAGIGPVYGLLRATGIAAPLWVAGAWQLFAACYWAAVLSQWPAQQSPNLATRADGASSVGIADLAPSIFTAFSLRRHRTRAAAAYAAHVVLVTMTTLLLHLGMRGPASSMTASVFIAACLAYLPLDLLAYLGLVAAADTLALARSQSALAALVSDARQRALRAQLEPHFLYNALNGAAALARRGNGREAAQVLGQLGELLRHVLGSAGSGDVTVEEELGFVSRYLDVERVRFGDRARFIVSAAPGARGARIPSLILQPLVENAIKHGIAQREAGGGEVRVTAAIDGERLVLTVADNGPGPSQTIAGTAAASAGLGINATAERLRLRYGTAASISLVRTPDGETRASIILPLEHV